MTEAWVEKPSFGKSLEEHLTLTGREIAFPIEACVTMLLECGLQEEVGHLERRSVVSSTSGYPMGCQPDNLAKLRCFSHPVGPGPVPGGSLSLQVEETESIAGLWRLGCAGVLGGPARHCR